MKTKLWRLDNIELIVFFLSASELIVLMESNKHDSDGSEGFFTFFSWYGHDDDDNDDKIEDNTDDDGDDDDLEENCVKAVALARFHSTEAPCGALSASTHLLLQ